MAKERGLESDECYCLDGKKEFPDIAIEVVLSSGVVDKLAIYEGLGVKELWVWKDDSFTLHHLRNSGYEVIPASELLPDLRHSSAGELCQTARAV